MPSPHPTKGPLARGRGPVSHVGPELAAPFSTNHWAPTVRSPWAFLVFNAQIIMPSWKKEAASFCLSKAQPSETPQGPLRRGLSGGWQCPRKCLSVGGIMPQTSPGHRNTPTFLSKGLVRKSCISNRQGLATQNVVLGPGHPGLLEMQYQAPPQTCWIRTCVFMTPAGVPALSSRRKALCQTVPKVSGLSWAPHLLTVRIPNWAYPHEPRDSPRSQDCPSSSRPARLPILLVSGFLVFVWVPLHLPAVKSSAAPSFLLSFLFAAGKPDIHVCYHCLQSKSKQALSKGPGDSQELSTKA